jgi:hypothetical protein
MMNNIDKPPQIVGVQYNSDNIRQPHYMALWRQSMLCIKRLEILPLHGDIRASFLQNRIRLQRFEQLFISTVILRFVTTRAVHTDRIRPAEDLVDFVPRAQQHPIAESHDIESENLTPTNQVHSASNTSRQKTIQVRTKAASDFTKDNILPLVAPSVSTEVDKVVEQDERID